LSVHNKLISIKIIHFQEQSTSNNAATIQSVRDSQRPANNNDNQDTGSDITEDQTENEQDADQEDDALQSILVEDEEIQEPANTKTTTTTTNNARKVVSRNRAATAVVARAPLTPASTSLLASGPSIFRTVAAVPRFRQEFVAAPVRSASVVQRGPLTYSLADAVSSGYYSYPGYGVAYEF
jgi:hypothetical protein